MAQDNKPALPPIEDLGDPEFIQSIVSMAMGGKTPDPAKVEQLGSVLPEFARLYRIAIKSEKRGASVSNQLNRIVQIREAAATLDALLTEDDDEIDTMEQLWRAVEKIKRLQEDFRSLRDHRPGHQNDGNPHRRERPQINSHLPPGLFRIDEIHRGVAELVKIATVAEKTLGATRGAKGGPYMTARGAKVRADAAHDIGSIFFWLTGERPRRKVVIVPREDVAGGQQSIEAGPWRDFLAAIMEKIFGDTRGLDGFSHKVVSGMGKNSPQYWLSLIHKKD